MAQRRHQPESAAPRLDELESAADKLAAWIATNPVIVLSALAGILVAAGIWGLVVSGRQEAREVSSAALSQTLSDYRRAMGGTAGQVEIPEPANPEIAERTRREFTERLGELAEEHRGTAAGALAALEAGALQNELGQPEAAAETWREALGQARGAVRAIILQRLGAAHEEAQRWSEAADAYEEAASIPENPAAREALALAARCRMVAGESAAAIALSDRLDADPNGTPIDGHIAHALRELRARSNPGS